MRVTCAAALICQPRSLARVAQQGHRPLVVVGSQVFRQSRARNAKVDRLYLGATAISASQELGQWKQSPSNTSRSQSNAGQSIDPSSRRDWEVLFFGDACIWVPANASDNLPKSVPRRRKKRILDARRSQERILFSLP